MKTEKELIEELENLYHHATTEDNRGISPIIKGLQEHSNNSEHGKNSDVKIGSDQEGRKSGLMKTSIIVFPGIIIVVACVLFFTLLLQEKSPLQNRATSVVTKTFRAPIKAIPQNPASPEIAAVITEPDIAPETTKSENNTEITEETPSVNIPTLKDLKITKDKATQTQPLSDLYEEALYTIQIRAFKTRHAAETLTQKLIGEEFDAHWERVKLRGGDVWYRVFIGYFQDPKDAQTLREILCTDDLLKECFIRKLR
ncbi:MAG: SPOR domain-containing protein [Thermodesulfobacteriota bacterium]|nr:SPOR domain-containing protein [Thermodesulfobacteriota bacterium]